MQSKNLLFWGLLCSILFTILMPFYAAGQGSLNMTLRDNWDQNTIAANSAASVLYNDIWAYVDDNDNEYAIMGSPEKVHFIDVTDPDNVSLVQEFTPGANTIWRDFKIYEHYAYAVADQGNEGLLIFDMTDIASGTVTLALQDNSDFATAHNVYIDVPNGRMYIAGSDSRFNGMWVYDLKACPENPTLLGSPNLGNYVHDVFVQDNIAYCSNIFVDALSIWDFTDAANPQYMANINQGGSNHSNWIFEDGTKLIYAGEASGVPLGIIDITNAANDDLTSVNTFKFPLEQASTGDDRIVYHNPFVYGDYAIVSSYYDGVTIFNISDPNNPTLDAYYDTFNNNGYSGYAADGCWGVYPYLPSGNIIASDTQTGLYVLTPDASIALPTGRCGNGVQDPFEQGVDCGGFCKPCVPTCSDGIKNGDEIGIDCGGPDCSPCSPGCTDPNAHNYDPSAQTDDGSCETCTDGIQNGDETDTDCGGVLCIACPTCNDGILNGDEQGVDCGGSNCAACPPEDCTIYDFTGQVNDYDPGNADFGTATVQDGGATLYVTDNGWKAVPINYTVTPATVLTFDFRSDTEGEIHEISFDNDLTFAPDFRIVVYGNQGYTGDLTNPTYSGSGNFESFSIPIGQSFTGTFQYLVLISDDDDFAVGDSYFRNIQIYEDYNSDLTCTNNTPPTCMDGIQNGDETGTDCGGTNCPPCTLGCTDPDAHNYDAAAQADDGSCETCTDGIINGDETDIDCGGVLCAACPTCSDGILNQDEVGVDCGGTNCAPCVEGCSTYDFTGQVMSYVDQDNGTATVQDGGATVYITGNGWKAVPINYTVTANTVLEFDFKSDIEGEIHEISFDTDLAFAPNQRIYLYGTDVGTNEYSGSGNYEHFTYAIGQFFTGTFTYLVLTCDNDATATGDSYFSNIQIYEDYNANLMCDDAPACPTNDNLSGGIASDTYQASNTIASTGVVANTDNVTFSANIICLDNGFEVELGGEFLGEINPCMPFEPTNSPTTIQDNKVSTLGEALLKRRVD